jgi:nitrous oxidase accessory protein NosD
LGNYWSDYEEKYPDAEEIDTTGIWDTPYRIGRDNDNYPLMPNQLLLKSKNLAPALQIQIVSLIF